MAETTPWEPAFDLRPDGIPKQRYTSPAFARLEAERLWPRAWQMACRLEEIPSPGDYVEYPIVDQSILVVRVDAQTIKAFHNACPHRGTQLALRAGCFRDGRIVCPFHGWTWQLDGTNAFVLDRGDFRGGTLAEGEPRLSECQVATWLGCVFVNPDPAAPPFEQHVAPIRDYLDPLLVDQMRIHWHRRSVIAANWKVAQEAFLEGYHTPGTHPQLVTPGSGPIHADIHYEVFPGGHSAFNRRGDTQAATESSRARRSDDLPQLIEELSRLEEGLDAMVLAGDVEVARSLRERPLPEGSGASGEFLKALYADAERRARPMPELERDTLLKWGGECFVFPNYLVLPQFGNALVYRSRPNGMDPDSCIFDVWSLRTYGSEETPPPPVVQEVPPDETGGWRRIALQDFANIPRIQRGLHSRGFDASLLSERQEIALPHMHRTLDAYLR